MFWAQEEESAKSRGGLHEDIEMKKALAHAAAAAASTIELPRDKLVEPAPPPIQNYDDAYPPHLPQNPLSLSEASKHNRQ